MVEFRKQLAEGLEYDTIGESVGFFRFGPDCAQAIARDDVVVHQRDEVHTEGLGDATHEEALRNVLLSNPESFGFEDVSGLPWIEIDFPEDVIRAADEILPAIKSDYPDF